MKKVSNKKCFYLTSFQSTIGRLLKRLCHVSKKAFKSFHGPTLSRSDLTQLFGNNQEEKLQHTTLFIDDIDHTDNLQVLIMAL